MITHTAALAKLRATQPRQTRKGRRTKAETDLQAKIVQELERAFPRAKVLRLNSGSVRVKRGYLHLLPKGTPDILVVLPRDRTCWLEVKTSEGMASDEQMEWAIWAAKSDHPHAYVRDVQSAIDAVRYASDRRRSA